MDKDGIVDLLKMDTEELYLNIGRQFFEQHALSITKGELLDISKKWFKVLWDKVSDKICNNEEIQRLRSYTNLEDRRVLLVLLIADLITEHVIKVEPWTVSALIVQIGLDNLCKGIWEEE